MHTSNRTIALASLLLTACGADSGGEEKDKPVTQYQPPNARPDLWGSPEAATFSLSDGKAFTKEDMAATADLIEYHQRVYLQGANTIAQGYVPKAFLARPGITFQDRTDGDIPGMEKMNAVIKRIQDRCGVFLPNRKSGIQLTVTWADQRITNQLTSPNSGGFFMSGAMTAIGAQWDSENAPPRKTLSFFQLASPENDIFINAEGFKKPKGGLRTWPDFFRTPGADFTGGPYWEDLTSSYKGYCLAPLKGKGTYADDTFAHELGHAYFTEWALQNGRSTYQTVKFREMFAELFADICYRDVNSGCVERWEPRTPDVDPFYVQAKFDLHRSNYIPPLDLDPETIAYPPFSKDRDCRDNFDCNELSKMERMRNFKNPGWEAILNPYDYAYRPFNLNVLAHMKYKQLWKPESRKQLFQALTNTLADMKGEKMPECAPKEAATEFTWNRREKKGRFTPTMTEPHEYAEFCPWGVRESTIRLSETEKPYVFTAREFYRVFEKHWPIPEEYRPAYESNRDYINAVWEY